MKATYLPDTHIYQYPDLEITLDRFVEEAREGVKCHILITSSRAPHAGLLHQGRFNLEAAQSRTQLTNKLHSRALEGWHDDTDFGAVLEEVCYQSLKRWREGDPLIDLRTYERPQRARWLLEPYVEYGGPTVMFARGKSGKSFLATGMCMSIAAGAVVVGIPMIEPAPCLYLDWETDEATHKERLDALMRGHGIDRLEAPIYYRRQVASISDSADHLRKEIATKGIQFAVIDSLGFARGGDPIAAEPTLRAFNAMRSLGIPILVTDHQSKDAIENKADVPYGSIYTENASRRLYRLTGHDLEPTEQGVYRKVLAVENTRSNNGRTYPRHAYEMTFINDADDGLVEATIHRTDITQFTEFADQLTAVDRIELILRAQNGAMTIKAISDASEDLGKRISEPFVKKLLNEGRGKRFVQLGSLGDRNAHTWGLLARSQA